MMSLDHCLLELRYLPFIVIAATAAAVVAIQNSFNN